ncbi:hypothetical protein AVO45_17535 [Ruegeria marisrubri]|uniref:DUF6473 domain-containing protein n=1 Tax=Ruegeria marisrubri TaxID=1685379 RepID=A0A0X3UAQ8_9RHOB|nr:hypothetical protein AVO45_17535 [Ruegeria marisrubri]
MDGPYTACLGGTETFGRFVGEPFPALLEQRIGRTCLNLGSICCGLEAMSGDETLIELANGAEVCILQVPGAHSLSNDLFRVHPRRNDRFLAPTEMLRGLYPEVDFTEFHFTRHLLGRLHALADARFETVLDQLRNAWSERLQDLIARLQVPVVLLWLRYESGSKSGAPDALGTEPLLVDSHMVSRLRPACAAIVEIPVRASAESHELEDMLFGVLQQPSAEHLIGPATHREISERLYRALMDLS